MHVYVGIREVHKWGALPSCSINTSHEPRILEKTKSGISDTVTDMNWDHFRCTSFGVRSFTQKQQPEWLRLTVRLKCSKLCCFLWTVCPKEPFSADSKPVRAHACTQPRVPVRLYIGFLLYFRPRSLCPLWVWKPQIESVTPDKTNQPLREAWDNLAHHQATKVGLSGHNWN